MIRELKVRVVKPVIQTPQCCVPVDAPTYNNLWRKERYEARPEWKHEQCQRASTLEIDGQPYCRIHAGQLALEKWLAGELVAK